jgi:hypothetical protein
LKLARAVDHGRIAAGQLERERCTRKVKILSDTAVSIGEGIAVLHIAVMAFDCLDCDTSLPKRRDCKQRNEKSYCESEPHALTTPVFCLSDYESKIIILVPRISASVGSDTRTSVVLVIKKWGTGFAEVSHRSEGLFCSSRKSSEDSSSPSNLLRYGETGFIVLPGSCWENWRRFPLLTKL